MAKLNFDLFDNKRDLFHLSIEDETYITDGVLLVKEVLLKKKYATMPLNPPISILPSPIEVQPKIVCTINRYLMVAMGPTLTAVDEKYQKLVSSPALEFRQPETSESYIYGYFNWELACVLSPVRGIKERLAEILTALSRY